MATLLETEAMGRTTLVVGVDSSPYATHVLTVARDIARFAPSGEMHVITVVRPQPAPPDVMYALPAFGTNDEDAAREARDMLRDLCATAFAGTGALVHLHVRVGRAAEQIELLAKEVHADVIVIEAHGRTGIARMFHRSVAAELARNAPCSVLTVRTKSGGAGPSASPAPAPSQPPPPRPH